MAIEISGFYRKQVFGFKEDEEGVDYLVRLEGYIWLKMELEQIENLLKDLNPYSTVFYAPKAVSFEGKNGTEINGWSLKRCDTVLKKINLIKEKEFLEKELKQPKKVWLEIKTVDKDRWKIACEREMKEVSTKALDKIVTELVERDAYGDAEFMFKDRPPLERLKLITDYIEKQIRNISYTFEIIE